MTSLKGDVEAGLAAADVVVKERYATDMTHAAPIEPHVALAEWRGGGVTGCSLVAMTPPVYQPGCRLRGRRRGV